MKKAKRNWTKKPHRFNRITIQKLLIIYSAKKPNSTKKHYLPTIGRSQLWLPGSVRLQKMLSHPGHPPGKRTRPCKRAPRPRFLRPSCRTLPPAARRAARWCGPWSATWRERNRESRTLSCLRNVRRCMSIRGAGIRVSTINVALNSTV